MSNAKYLASAIACAIGFSVSVAMVNQGAEADNLSRTILGMGGGFGWGVAIAALWDQWRMR